MKLRLFRKRASADPVPVKPNRFIREFGYFTQDQMNPSYLDSVSLARLKYYFIENGLYGFEFSHRTLNSNHLRPVYKPHSVQRTPPYGAVRLCDHLSGRRVAAPLGAAYPRLALPPRERARMKTSSLPSSADNFVPAWPCSRRGLPGHPHYCRCRWSFTPPFHHDPPPSCLPQILRIWGRGPKGGGGGCLFLWPFYPAGCLLNGGFPAPGAIRRRALWSADFPRSRQRRTAIARPT